MRKYLLSFVLTFGVVMGMIVPALAQDATPTSAPEATTAPTAAPLTATTDLFVTSQFRVNVRSGPGLQYTPIGILAFGDSLDITGQNTDGTWLRVNFNGQEGWVSASVVEVNGAIEGAPVVEAGAGATVVDTAPGAESTAEASGDVTVRTRFNTNLRSTFSTSGEVLARIPFNTDLVPEGRTNDSNWLMVTFDGQIGWVYAPILFFSSGEVETLPITGTVPEVQPTTEATAEPAA